MCGTPKPELARKTANVWPWPLDHLQGAIIFLAVTAAFDSEGEFFRCTLHSSPIPLRQVIDRVTGQSSGNRRQIVFQSSTHHAMVWNASRVGFSALHTLAELSAFLPMPAIMLGLYALQRPQIAKWGLVLL